jgi:chloramphenicol 3-O-phosphotransferase
VAGREEMTPDASEEALAQLRLRYRLGALAADTYHASGYVVVLEDVIAGEELDRYVAWIRARPLHVVVLLPTEEAIAERENRRSTTGYSEWDIADLRRDFAEGTPRIGLWLDTSEQTPVETVDEIVARSSEAMVGPSTARE